MARWRLLEPEADVVSALARATDLDTLGARTLANRGVAAENAEGFLSPSLGTVRAPEEDAWRVAAERVARAVRDGERIGVFGDYDTDGITSAAVLFLAISRYTSNVTVALPTRQTGYGLLEPYVRDRFAEGIDLLITADCGISNGREVELAKSLGMDVIVTDHHIPPDDPPSAPPAVAVLDPKLWDMEDPLAGVGVAWKLAWAIAREMADPDGRRHIGGLLDLVSIGTVVDIAPLVGDNRTLASVGLRYANRALSNGTVRPGIAALTKVAGVRGRLDEGDLGWKLGPRLNSVGRIKHPRPALDLLLANDSKEAFRIAWMLNQLNSERQQRTRRAVEDALAVVDPEQDFKVVVVEEGHAGGLAGLVAGKVAGATGRPAAILSRRVDGSYGGSARAGETNADLHGALYGVRHLLGEWGGHRKAAGLSVKPGCFDEFVAGVNREVAAQVEQDPEILDPAIELDAEVPIESVSNGMLDWLERLAPFGSGNYRPVFASGGMSVLGTRQLWEGMNLITLKGGVKAKLAGPEEAVPSEPFDAAYSVRRNDYTGGAELEILDWRT